MYRDPVELAFENVNNHNIKIYGCDGAIDNLWFEVRKKRKKQPMNEKKKHLFFQLTEDSRTEACYSENDHIVRKLASIDKGDFLTDIINTFCELNSRNVSCCLILKHKRIEKGWGGGVPEQDMMRKMLYKRFKTDTQEVKEYTSYRSVARTEYVELLNGKTVEKTHYDEVPKHETQEYNYTEFVFAKLIPQINAEAYFEAENQYMVCEDRIRFLERYRPQLINITREDKENKAYYMAIKDMDLEKMKQEALDIIIKLSNIDESNQF